MRGYVLILAAVPFPVSACERGQTPASAPEAARSPITGTASVPTQGPTATAVPASSTSTALPEVLVDSGRRRGGDRTLCPAWPAMSCERGSDAARAARQRCCRGRQGEQRRPPRKGSLSPASREYRDSLTGKALRGLAQTDGETLRGLAKPMARQGTRVYSNKLICWGASLAAGIDCAAVLDGDARHLADGAGLGYNVGALPH